MVRPTPQVGEQRDWLRCRPFALGPLRVHILTNDHAVQQRCDELFGALPEGEVGTASAVDIEVMRQSSPEGQEWFETIVGGEPGLVSSTWAASEQVLTRTLNARLRAAEEGMLHLHVGAVARDGRAVLFAAPSRGGKSTLVTQLALSGWTYLTDDQLTLDPSDCSVLAYPRPISLREDAWGLFPDLEPLLRSEVGQVGGANYSGRTELAPRRLGQSATGRLEVGVIMVPRLALDQSESSLRPIDAAQMVEVLVQQTFDLELLGEAGVDALVRLAASCPSFELTRGADQRVALPELLRQALDQRRDAAVQRIASSDRGPVGTRRWLVADGVACWMVDGAAILYDPTSRQVARLDELGAALWAQLAGIDEPDDKVSDQVLGNRFDDLLETLVEAGFLVDSFDSKA